MNRKNNSVNTITIGGLAANIAAMEGPPSSQSPRFQYDAETPPLWLSYGDGPVITIRHV